MTRSPALLAIALALATPAVAQSPSLSQRKVTVVTGAVDADTNFTSALVPTIDTTNVSTFRASIAIVDTAASIMLEIDPDGAGATDPYTPFNLREDGADLEVGRQYTVFWDGVPGQTYKLQMSEATTIVRCVVVELRGGIAVAGKLGGSSGGGSGDIEGVTAGNGLTGGGASGAVSLAVGAGTGISVNANDVALTIPVVETLGGTGQTTYTQGDLLYSDAADSLAKLALGGTVGEILHQVSATAPGYSDASIAAVDSQGIYASTFLGEIAAAGDATIDFGDGAMQTLAVSGNITFDTTLSGLAASKSRHCTILMTADGSGPYTLGFPTEWQWIGTKPSSLAASTSALLFMTAWGPDEEDVIARYVVLGDGS